MTEIKKARQIWRKEICQHAIGFSSGRRTSGSSSSSFSAEALLPLFVLSRGALAALEGELCGLVGATGHDDEDALEDEDHRDDDAAAEPEDQGQ